MTLPGYWTGALSGLQLDRALPSSCFFAPTERHPDGGGSHHRKKIKMIFAILLGSSLVFGGSLLHFLVLRQSARWIDPERHPVQCFSLAMCIIIIAHLFSALMFAVAFHIGEFQLGFGTLMQASPDAPPPRFMDRFYFSLVNLTTLGRGDLLPTGHLRFLTAMEALLGFLVITGSGAFLLSVINSRGRAGSG